ncbi:reverse transcriptase domain-containing protein [Tanacetum coccineum]
MFKQTPFRDWIELCSVEMPNVQQMVKVLLRKQAILEEIAITTVNAECSAIIMNKVHEKLEDPGKFLIPCALKELDGTSALADLEASIEPFTHSIYKKLGLEALTPTRMTLELANRLITHPMGIAEDVVVRVDGFTFLADFVVVNFEPDPRVPIILGRPFLRTAKALIDLYEETLTLRFFPEKTSEYFEKFADELAPLDSLPPENDKDVEIKSSSSFTLTSPEESEFKLILKEIRFHRELILPSLSLEVSSESYFPYFTGEKVLFMENAMFFSLVRFVWKMMESNSIRKKILCLWQHNYIKTKLLSRLKTLKKSGKRRRRFQVAVPHQ